MKVYVAASSNEIDRAKRCIAYLHQHGIETTSTWIESIERVGVANPRDASKRDRAMWANGCMVDIQRADIVWLLAVEVGSGRGAYFELGYAVAIDKPRISSGDTTQSIFCAFTRELADDLAAADYLIAMASDERPAALTDTGPVRLPPPPQSPIDAGLAELRDAPAIGRAPAVDFAFDMPEDM